MEAADQKLGRLNLLFFLMLAALMLLAGRLVVFHINSGEKMTALAAGQQKMNIPIPARRGNIYAADASGYQLMATSTQVPAAFVDPLLIPDDQLDEVAVSVGDILAMSPAKIKEIITSRRGRRFAWLAKDIDEVAAEKLRALKISGIRGIRGIRGIGIQYRWKRFYPNGALAAHIVGFVGTENKGLDGVEMKLDEQLGGTDGSNSVISDAARRPIWNREDMYSQPVDGSHVYLTIDTFIQSQLEEVLDETVKKYMAESAVGVVIEPATGRILAMASLPEFDLNAFGRADSDSRRNRSITDIYEPGSIFKPFTAVAALADGVVDWGEEFFCHNGAYRCRRGRTLHDTHPYGKLSVEAIVYKSSNIGMALIGERLGIKRLYAVLRNFGFGEKTDIILPGEQFGLVRPQKQWSKDSVWSVPMGHEVGVTALQVAMAFSAIANGGELLYPILVDRLVAPDGTELDRSVRTVRRRVLPEQVARRFVTDALAKTPLIGTSHNRGDLDGWSSFGKTGTAQIPPYPQKKYIASYIAGAPVDYPRLVCLISIRDPDSSVGYYGGVVAAPAVKRVLEKSLAYMGIPRDMADGEMISAPAH